MKKLSLMFLACVSINAFAQIELKCKVQNPCKYSARGDLGYCLSTVDVRKEGNGSRLVASRLDLTTETFFFAADIPVTITKTKISGQDEDGENHVQISRKTGKGTLTIEQDFPFSITCK